MSITFFHDTLFQSSMVNIKKETSYNKIMNYKLYYECITDIQIISIPGVKCLKVNECDEDPEHDDDEEE